MTLDPFADYLAQFQAVLLVAESSEETIQQLMQQAEQSLNTEQIANLLEAFPPETRLSLWHSIDNELLADVFLAMREDSRKLLIKLLDDSECQQLLTTFDAEDLLELAEDLPERFLDYAISQMDSEQRKLYELAQLYSLDQIGHWVSFECPRVSRRLKAVSAQRILKKGIPRYSEVIYTIDREGKLTGEIPITSILLADPNEHIEDLQSSETISLQASIQLQDAADEVINSGRMALPVIDVEGSLIGRLDIAEAHKVKQELHDEQMAKSGGLTEDEDLFAPVWKSSKNRAVWLGINLLTAFLASWFIGLFEHTLQQVVALAVLMPIVASMGGISGSQTLTVIVRGLALGQVTDANRRALLKKEVRVGALNGVLWALVIGYLTWLWFGQAGLGITIAIAIMLNIVTAVVSGVFIPSILDKLKFDPALAGSVILTTVTDVVGFVTFLGLGSLFLV